MSLFILKWIALSKQNAQLGNGDLTPPYGIDSLAETVKHLRANPVETREMRRKGRVRALEMYDFQKFLDRLEAIPQTSVCG